jgi:lactoylglutathione lyase
MATGDLRVELFTNDIERTVEFYEQVLGFEREADSPGYVAVRRGDIVIGIGLSANLPDAHPIKPREGERLGLGVELVVEVDDIDAEYASVQASGYAIATPIAERPWGLRDFRLVDPNGYYIRVTSRE